MTTDPRDALPPRLDPACTCVCHSQPGVMHVAPCCRVVDPKDAEIARLTAELFEMTRSRDEWRNDFRALEKAIVGDTGLSAMTVAVQARLFRPRAEKAEAERDAALAQVAALREVVKFHERLTVDPSTLSRRDAQMRAEGMRKAVEVADSWQADENKPMTMRASILVAAEKEAQG